MKRQDRIKNLKHQGYRTYRLNSDLNEKELIFLEKMNEMIEMDPLIFNVFTESENHHFINFSEDTKKTVMTVIQWLGTNVGQSLLRNVQEKIELNKINKKF